MKKTIIGEKTQGFTLIELMLVVMIIGILSAIAIPAFLNYQCKAKQTEARQGLGTIAKLEENYYVHWNGYTSDLSAIGFSMKGKSYYDYSMTDATATAYTAQAQSKPGLFLDKTDVWTIDHALTLVNTSNACK
jgi:prepilin-type N-terminal cleavage/methylation domain-containing protein